MKKLLLHICCAPCSAGAVLFLKDDFDIAYYWHNPNIWDEAEYDKRKESAKMYASKLGYLFFEESNFVYNYDEYLNFGGETCANCYRSRLEQAAKFAKENGFDCWTTSLLSSPYQKHDLIKEIGEEVSKKYGIEFIYVDFRPKFYEGKTLAKEAGSYMQKYCACKKSKK